jgi:hypothetical protein
MKIGRIALLLAVLVLFGNCAYAADCNGGLRYEDSSFGTVTDCRTGLVWLKDANCIATSNGITNSGAGISWYDAMKWTAGLQNSKCGLTDGSAAGDWRLPTKTELMAMVTYAKKIKNFTEPALTDAIGSIKCSAGCIFSSVQTNSFYWSVNTFAGDPASAWILNMYTGNMEHDYKVNTFYVWPVRGGQSGSFGSLRIE